MMTEIIQANTEKPKEEDEALKQKAVTYIQLDDLPDFDADHLFITDNDKYTNSHLPD